MKLNGVTSLINTPRQRLRIILVGVASSESDWINEGALEFEMLGSLDKIRSV